MESLEVIEQHGESFKVLNVSVFKPRFFSSSKTTHGFINIDTFTLLQKKYRMLQRNWG